MHRDMISATVESVQTPPERTALSSGELLTTSHVAPVHEPDFFDDRSFSCRKKNLTALEMRICKRLTPTIATAGAFPKRNQETESEK